MTTLYLVRHGITSANKENRFAGRTSEELIAEGIAQMSEVGKRLCNKNIAAVYCGPAKRTKQSAEILGSLLKVPIISLDELAEIEIPHWDGLTKDEIREKYGSQYPTWLSAPQIFNLPGCETLAQVQKRAIKGVNRILSEMRGQNAALVSHLIVLRCLVLYLTKKGIEDFRSIKIDNGSIIVVSGEAADKMSLSFL